MVAVVTDQKEPNDKETDREDRTPRETRRVQFEFSDALVDEMDRLVEDLDASSRGEVMRLALGLLKVATHGRDRGARIILEEGDVKKELVLPIATPAIKR